MANHPRRHDATPSLLPAYLARQQSRFLEAVNRFNRQETTGPAGIHAALFAWQWLRQEIHPAHRRAVLAVSRNPEHHWLAELLDQAVDLESCVAGFLNHWQTLPDHPKAAALREWAQLHPVHPGVAILTAWKRITPFQNAPQEKIRRIQHHQKKIALEVGGALDRERIALVDQLPDPTPLPSWAKVGFIPRMACSQSCRHCMFVWRDPMKQTPDPTPLLEWIQQHTESLLFTGGELHGQLPLFHQAIRTLTRIRACGILLNGATATSPEAAHQLFQELEQARTQRDGSPGMPLEITLQISFDEFHQEIVADRDGSLHERIPVANIARLIMAAVAFPNLRLVLLHKQNRLNFSRALLEQGVLARLQQALHLHGQTLRPIRHALSPRSKADPVDHRRTGPVIRDVVFVLDAHPDHPIHFMSSTIDGYGRAALLDPSEFIDERLYLEQILNHGAPPEERFDIDPMIRADGMVSCFGAAHLWLGNLLEESREKIRSRQAKDPLLQALERFDPRIPRFYQEIAGDLEQQVAQATGPHHLFHRLTERAALRLHLTRRLMGAPG
ncbi:MAG: hypothetical protein HQL91_06095 [Magnetococcales bacterium]|nr:hypothetical protein [Magnetococcales bacterium]